MPLSTGSGGFTDGETLSGGSTGTHSMSVTHTITKSYSGGSNAAKSVTISATGESEVNISQACAGSATTSLTPVLVMDPDNAIEGALFSADGNCTLAFTNAALTATTIGLTANTPVIVDAVGSAALLSLVPTSADTYTLSCRNASTVTVNLDVRMVIN